MNTILIPRFLKMCLIISLGVVISGCASLSKDECLQGRWQDIGYEDGSKGYVVTRFESHRKACAEHGVTADFRAYEAGYHDGLRYFCAPANGLRVGEQGAVYEWICPPELEPGFVRQYLLGLENRHRDIGHTRDRVRDDLYQCLADLRRTDNKDAREELNRRIDSLESELDSLKSESDDMYSLIERARQRLDDIRYRRDQGGYKRMN
ncbi:MAG: DUF2799 domain-containing protein [Pseudomonadota bacterium]